MSFDPSVTASYKVGIFGLPVQRESARLILLPVPWDATTSYGGGAADGPEAILKASPQIDLFDLETEKAYEQGYFMEPISSQLQEQNAHLRAKALQIRNELEENNELSGSAKALQSEVNKGCTAMVEWVYAESKKILANGQLLGLVGGDHSTPEGAIHALSEKHKGEFGILHIDAHADLRNSYQGFKHSHASIMYNVMNSDWRPRQLVQVGIRDFSGEEFQLIKERKDIRTFFDVEIKNELLNGTPWSLICRHIIESLPQKVYISFDIDGLSPEFCPHTGTPVPGGLTFDQVLYLFSAMVKAKKTIIGFDLNEVAPHPEGLDEWDGNVGARLLYKLCGWTVTTNPERVTV